MRFEKSLDPENTIRGFGARRTIASQIAPGIRADGRRCGRIFRRPPPSLPIDLPAGFIDKKFGKHLPSGEVARILNRWASTLRESADASLSVSVPTWRATKDISMKDDLVEEIGRMVGYDSITPTPPLIASTVPAQSSAALLTPTACETGSAGLQRSAQLFVCDRNLAKRFGFDLATHIAVKNPIASELTHLAAQPLPGLFQSILPTCASSASSAYLKSAMRFIRRPATINGSPSPGSDLL